MYREAAWAYGAFAVAVAVVVWGVIVVGEKVCGAGRLPAWALGLGVVLASGCVVGVVIGSAVAQIVRQTGPELLGWLGGGVFVVGVVAAIVRFFD